MHARKLDIAEDQAILFEFPRANGSPHTASTRRPPHSHMFLTTARPCVEVH